MGEAPSFNLPEGEYVFSGDVVVELEKVPEVNETTAPQMKPVPSELSPCGRDIVVYGLLDKIFIVSIDFIHKETCKREAMEKVPSRIVRLDARSSADAGSLEVATSLENGRVLLMTFDYIDGTYTTKGRKMRYFHVEPSIKAPAVEIAFIQGTEPGENPVERGSAGEIVDLFIGTENGEVWFYVSAEEETALPNPHWEKKKGGWLAADYGEHNNPRRVWKVANKQVTGIKYYCPPDADKPDEESTRVSDAGSYIAGNSGEILLSRRVAISSKDGVVAVFDVENAALLCYFESFFGQIKALAMSRDGEILATGGEDDTVVLWSISDCTCIAMSEAHGACVTGIAFDDWESSGASYRFASVGEDRWFMVYEFCPATLLLPRHRAPSFPVSFRGRKTSLVGSQGETIGNSVQWAASLAEQIPHCVAPRPSQTPTVDPLCRSRAHPDPLSAVYFMRNCMLTVSWDRRIALWKRPDI